MARYFEIKEIDRSEFVCATGDDLNCNQLVVRVNGDVFIALDDKNEYEIQIPLDCFN